MAFSAFISRFASSAVSTAARASGRARHGESLGRSIPSQTLGSTRGLLPYVSSSSFSTWIATKPKSDDNLLNVIDAEIMCAEESDYHDQVEGIPEGFPFEIQDEKGKNIIRLKRTYHDENIEVNVAIPGLVTEDGHGPFKKQRRQSAIPLTLNVIKGGSPTIQFSCSARPADYYRSWESDSVTIDAMSVRQEDKDSDEEVIPYEGLDFSDMDWKLQRAFEKYLESRGVSALKTDFMQEYMSSKDSREYLFWLRNLKQFFEK